MKKKELLLSELKQIARKLNKTTHKQGNFVGLLDGIPVYADKKVPYGELWMKSEKEWNKFVISDLDKPIKKWWQFWK